MSLTVAFRCNDERGNPEGYVDNIDIVDEMRLYCRKAPPVLRRIDAFGKVQVGRCTLRCGEWTPWFGNVFWDATTLSLTNARALVAYLLRHDWAIEEHAEDGPLADLVQR